MAEASSARPGAAMAALRSHHVVAAIRRCGCCAQAALHAKQWCSQAWPTASVCSEQDRVPCRQSGPDGADAGQQLQAGSWQCLVALKEELYWRSSVGKIGGKHVETHWHALQGRHRKGSVCEDAAQVSICVVCTCLDVQPGAGASVAAA